MRIVKDSRRFKMGAIVGVMSMGVLLGVTSSPAAAAPETTMVTTFDVHCTQSYVNDGQPFPAHVVARLTIPETIRAGDEIVPSVSLDITLPPVVAETIIRHGFETLQGSIDATIQVVEGDQVETRKATGFDMPVMDVVSSTGSLDFSTTPVFASFTPKSAGQIRVRASDEFVVLNNVEVSNGDDESTELGPFTCGFAEPQVLFSKDVLPAVEDSQDDSEGTSEGASGGTPNTSKSLGASVNTGGHVTSDASMIPVLWSGALAAVLTAFALALIGRRVRTVRDAA